MILPDEPIVIHLSPPHQDPEHPWEVWGYHQFPDMWRTPAQAIYLGVNIGIDSEIGSREQTCWYKSLNDGKTWARISQDEVNMEPVPILLPDGTQIKFGKQEFIYHFSSYAPGHETPRIYPEAAGVTPAAGPWWNGYSHGEQAAYRLGDIPENLRRFPLSIRKPGEKTWQETTGIFDIPDLLKSALIRQKKWYEDVAEDQREWVNFQPHFNLPMPRGPRVVVCKDHTLLTIVEGQNPQITDRRFDQIICIESGDGGKTWRKRGIVTNDTKNTSFGYGGGEQEIIALPDGDLLCVMRTQMHYKPQYTKFLAACRSTDGGYTWTEPAKIAEFSVTPKLLYLQNGTLVLAYGRPGVYVRTSQDQGKTWSPSLNIIGPDELTAAPKAYTDWWLEGRVTYSCGNIDAIITGPDQFLLAYSDFNHPHPDGGKCKAVLVQQITVSNN